MKILFDGMDQENSKNKKKRMEERK